MLTENEASAVVVETECDERSVALQVDADGDGLVMGNILNDERQSTPDVRQSPTPTITEPCHDDDDDDDDDDSCSGCACVCAVLIVIIFFLILLPFLPFICIGFCFYHCCCKDDD